MAIIVGEWSKSFGTISPVTLLVFCVDALTMVTLILLAVIILWATTSFAWFAKSSEQNTFPYYRTLLGGCLAFAAYLLFMAAETSTWSRWNRCMANILMVGGMVLAVLPFRRDIWGWLLCDVVFLLFLLDSGSSQEKAPLPKQVNKAKHQVVSNEGRAR